MKTHLESFLFKKGFIFQLMKKKKNWEYTGNNLWLHGFRGFYSHKIKTVSNSYP